MKHFETLWEDSEQLASRAIMDEKNDLIDSISKLLQDYKSIENESTKIRKYGEILFRLTKLSKLDNINVYKALQINIQYESIPFLE